MGNIIESKCRHCSFEIIFNYGGNKFDYRTNCPVPAINIETDDLENVNYFCFKNNPKYKFYSDEELKGDNQGCKILGNFNLVLNTVNNYCPKCKNYTLDFEVTSYTD